MKCDPGRAEAGLNVNASPSHSRTSGLPLRAEGRPQVEEDDALLTPLDQWTHGYFIDRQPGNVFVTAAAGKGKDHRDTHIRTHCRWMEI